MRAWAAFLRGINVTGRRVKGPELCAVLEAIGCTEVSAFRASGNLVFDAEDVSEARLTGEIERGLEQALGYEVTTFLRSAGEVLAIASSQPFDAATIAASNGKLQVAMLGCEPSAKAREAVLARATEDDRLAFGERELFWLPAAGTQQSGLDWKPIEAALGPSTHRTMGTVEQIAAKHFSA